MAPQATGKTANRGAYIWAFGVVLAGPLAVRQLFDGEGGFGDSCVRDRILRPKMNRLGEGSFDESIGFNSWDLYTKSSFMSC